MSEQAGLRKELGLGDLVMAQVLCVVGSTWVGIAAKLGRAHVAFWLGAMVLYYVPLAAVVIYLNRMMPLEGGLYQWAKSGFGEMAGFLTAWNLWVYAVIVTGAIIFVIPTDLGYILGAAGAWIPASKLATLVLTGGVMAGITLVAIRGLDIGKWLHNVGSIGVMAAYVILLGLPLWALLRGTITHYEPIPWQPPRPSWFGLAIFGQMTVGALSGFEYVAILAGESRNAARTIGQSVVISAPIIALMFILGTSSVLTFVGTQPINVIGPIPQTMRSAFGDAGWAAPLAISLLMMRAVASSSLIFTGLTRLPMTAGWDNLVPRWFARLHPNRRTPVNSILFVAALVMLLIFFSMLGVREQEASQLLAGSSIALYAIAYVALFALPLLGRHALRSALPAWVKVLSLVGLVSSLVSLVIMVYPIIDVTDPGVYAAKICAVVVVSNMLGVAIYKRGKSHRRYLRMRDKTSDCQRFPKWNFSSQKFSQASPRERILALRLRSLILKGRIRPLTEPTVLWRMAAERTHDMTNDKDNRVLGRKGARTLSDEELLQVPGGSGTLKISHLPNGIVDTLADF